MSFSVSSTEQEVIGNKEFTFKRDNLFIKSKVAPKKICSGRKLMFESTIHDTVLLINMRYLPNVCISL